MGSYFLRNPFSPDLKAMLHASQEKRGEKNYEKQEYHDRNEKFAMNEGRVHYTLAGHREVRSCRLSMPEQLVIARKLGEVYRDNAKRAELCRITAMAPSREIENCIAYVRCINRSVDDCDSESQLIIRKDFLEKPPEKWYLAYMSERHYYTARRKAVQEFLSCLNLWTVVK